MVRPNPFQRCPKELASTQGVPGLGCTWGATVVRRYAASSPVAALGSFSPGTSTRQRTCKGNVYRSLKYLAAELCSSEQAGMLEQPCALKPPNPFAN